mmetsp:Transcript_15790/g.22562  ORF Transcript_15790/g.22562 Transcript_15790/m.22562 type:complete len:505 (+) Transcript_15790:84-1598(+)
MTSPTPKGPIFRDALDTLRGKKLKVQLDPNSSIVSLVKIEEKLAEGGSAFVYFVSEFRDDNRKTKQRMALKVTPLHTHEKYRLSLSESKLLQKLSHDNIVKCYGGIIAQQHSDAKVVTDVHLLFLEYCVGGSLFDALATMRRPYYYPQPISTSKYSRVLKRNKSVVSHRNTALQINFYHLRRIATILEQASSAISYLHSQSIIHFDIKLENILLLHPLNIPSFCCSTEEEEVHLIKIKLCDLGSAYQGTSLPVNTSAQRQITADLISKSTTPMYKAPECVDSLLCNSIDQKIDVWSFGCVTYQLLFYQHVWEDYLGIPSSLPPKAPKRLGYSFTKSARANLPYNTNGTAAMAQTPNLAILSGKYYLPPLHPVVPLAIPRIDCGPLYDFYIEFAQMIEQEMLVVQPTKRASMESIHKELERLHLKLSTSKSPTIISHSSDCVKKSLPRIEDRQIRLTNSCFTLQPWAEDVGDIPIDNHCINHSGITVATGQHGKNAKVVQTSKHK